MCSQAVHSVFLPPYWAQSDQTHMLTKSYKRRKVKQGSGSCNFFSVKLSFLALLWVSVKITQLYYCGLKSIMDNIQRASLFVGQ